MSPVTPQWPGHQWAPGPGWMQHPGGPVPLSPYCGVCRCCSRPPPSCSIPKGQQCPVPCPQPCRGLRCPRCGRAGDTCPHAVLCCACAVRFAGWGGLSGQVSPVATLAYCLLALLLGITVSPPRCRVLKVGGERGDTHVTVPCPCVCARVRVSVPRSVCDARGWQPPR